MTNSTNDAYTRKKLYINAYKTVMEKLFLHNIKYISYLSADNTIKHVKGSKTGLKVYINDDIGAFFDYLCRRLCDEIYKNDFIVTILSPYHRNEVIWGIYIPFFDSCFMNTAAKCICKDIQLYTFQDDFLVKSCLKSASDFIILSEKIQQAP